MIRFRRGVGRQIPLAGEGSVSRGEPGEWTTAYPLADRTPTCSRALTDSLARKGEFSPGANT